MVVRFSKDLLHELRRRTGDAGGGPVHRRCGTAAGGRDRQGGRLRAGGALDACRCTAAALPRVGTFLRAFTFGHVRQLDKAAEGLLARAWEAGVGPEADEVMFVDLDSTLQEVFGYDKQGAAYDYTGRLGYHPVLATRAATGEVLHARHRTGSANTARGAERFVRELAGRIQRAGHNGPVVVRADSGFWSSKMLDACTHHGLEFSVTVRQTSRIRRLIDAIDDEDWKDIDGYPEPNTAQVAETKPDGHRLVVRRVHHPDAADDQGQLFETWRHHPFVTNRDGDAAVLDAEHRAHAKIELAIRDLKDGGWAHNPQAGALQRHCSGRGSSTRMLPGCCWAPWLTTSPGGPACSACPSRPR